MSKMVYGEIRSRDSSDVRGRAPLHRCRRDSDPLPRRVHAGAIGRRSAMSPRVHNVASISPSNRFVKRGACSRRRTRPLFALRFFRTDDGATAMPVAIRTCRRPCRTRVAIWRAMPLDECGHEAFRAARRRRSEGAGRIEAFFLTNVCEEAGRRCRWDFSLRRWNGGGGGGGKSVVASYIKFGL